MKKRWLFLLLTVLLLLPLSARAEGPDEALDRALAGEDELLTGETAGDVFRGVLDGSFSLSGQSVAENLLTLLFSSFREALPDAAALLSVTALLSLVKNGELLGNKLGDSLLWGGQAVMAAVTARRVLKTLTSVKAALQSMERFASVLSPILLTLLAASGASSSAGGLASPMTMLSTVAISLVTELFLPLVLLSFMLGLIAAVLPESGLDGLAETGKSVVSWGGGLVFTLFSGLIALQGKVSAVRDTVALRGLRYAISSAVPVIGGSVGESLSAALTAAYSLRSAAGVTGMLAVVSLLLRPALSLTAVIWLFRLLGTLTRPMAGDLCRKMTSAAVSSLSLALALVVGSALLWLILSGFVLSAGGTL